MANSTRILVVDDEAAIVRMLLRGLREHYEIDGTSVVTDALKMAEQRPYDVVISDQRMPEMTGAAFLGLLRERVLNKIRIMMSGYTDFESAMLSINQANVAHFLHKPFTIDDALQAVEKALRLRDLKEKSLQVLAQFPQPGAQKPATLSQEILRTTSNSRQIHEPEMVEKTLHGCVRMVHEILSFVRPDAFRKTTRIHTYVKHINGALAIKQGSLYELAAMVSQIGLIGVPLETLNKMNSQITLDESEQSVFLSHTVIANSLLRNIPHLEDVAAIIGLQHVILNQQAHDYLNFDNQVYDAPIVLGANMLAVANDFDDWVMRGLSSIQVLDTMERSTRRYDKVVLQSLSTLRLPKVETSERLVLISELLPYMTLDQSIRTKNGMVVMTREQSLSDTMIDRLKQFDRGVGIVQPIRVRMQVRLQP